LRADTAWLDGEACHVEEDGRTSFSGLQDDLSSGRTSKVHFFAFDLLHLDGHDLTRAALEDNVHWVKPELVVEVTYLTWTADGIMRHVSFQGLREDKPAREVVRPVS
jgi:ATP-dependent DNA ligase